MKQSQPPWLHAHHRHPPLGQALCERNFTEPPAHATCRAPLRPATWVVRGPAIPPIQPAWGPTGPSISLELHCQSMCGDPVCWVRDHCQDAWNHLDTAALSRPCVSLFLSLPALEPLANPVGSSSNTFRIGLYTSPWSKPPPSPAWNITAASSLSALLLPSAQPSKRILVKSESRWVFPLLKTQQWHHMSLRVKPKTLQSPARSWTSSPEHSLALCPLTSSTTPPDRSAAAILASLLFPPKKRILPS